MLDLGDMFRAVVPVSDDGFQGKLSEDLSFAIYASAAEEEVDIRKNNVLFRHQALNREYLTHYQRILVLDEPGTGKTCNYVSFQERVIDYIYDRMRYSPDQAYELSGYRGVVVLVKGANQESDFRRQLVCKCSRRERYDGSSQNFVTRQISSKNIQIWHYGSFVNKLKDYKTVADAAGAYNGYLFFIDEAHNLVPKVSDTTKARSDLNKTTIYNSINELLQSAVDIAVVGATATPVSNELKELIKVINLFLPEPGKLPATFDVSKVSKHDRRVLFPDMPEEYGPEDNWAPYYEPKIPEDFEFKKKNLDVLYTYIKGYITFVRALDTGVDLIYQKSKYSEVLPDKEVRDNVYCDKMRGLQLQAYNAEREIGDITRNQAVMISVYPDGKSGAGGAQEMTKKQLKEAISRMKSEGRSKATIKKYEGYLANATSVKRADTQQRFHKFFEQKDRHSGFVPKKEVIDFLTQKGKKKSTKDILKRLGELSAVFASILSKELDNEGKCPIYSERLYAAGAYELGAYMSVFGYEMLVPVTTTGTYKGSSFCETGGGSHQPVGKGKRYAVLSSSLNKATARAILKIFNSPENFNGEIVKFLIYTETGREGINLTEGVAFHDVYGHWTESGMFQSRMRVKRADSHLLTRQRNRELGITGRIEVPVYYHCALPNIDEDSKYPFGFNYHVYHTAHQKDKENSKGLRMVYQCSNTCIMHRRRNVRPEDVDGSKECLYDKCAYKCHDDAPSFIVDRSAVSEISDIQKRAVVEAIRTMFRQRSAYSSSEIESEITGFQKKKLHCILRSLMNEHQVFESNFGIPQFLNESNGIYFMMNAYPRATKESHDMSFYTRNLIFKSNYNIAEIAQRLAAEAFPEVRRIASSMETYGEVKDYILSQNFYTQVMLLEDALSNITLGNPDETDRRIYRIFSLFVYFVPYPRQKILNRRDQIQGQVTGRKRKVDKSFLERNERRLPENEMDIRKYLGETVDDAILSAHTLYTQANPGQMYGVTNRFLSANAKIRILLPTEARKRGDTIIGWRDAFEEEHAVLKEVFQVINNIRMASYIERDAYGLRLRGAELLIIAYPERYTGRKSDSEYRHTGKVCTTWDTLDLQVIAYIAGVKLPKGKTYKKNEIIRRFKRDNMPKLNYSKWSLDLLNYIERIRTDKKVSEKSVLCGEIERALGKKGAFLEDLGEAYEDQFEILKDAGYKTVRPKPMINSK